ncbi:His Kinase A (phospho-acceptor) domain-containing protein [Eubacterium ruminantium]|nr:His Kinase A (phospho-acceptor) domain-containing protein [Eubacterium ruminantium]
MKKSKEKKNNTPNAAVSDKKLLKRLRIKFCLIMMIIVVVFLFVVYSAQYISNKHTMDENSNNALIAALSRFERNGPWDMPGNEEFEPGANPPGDGENMNPSGDAQENNGKNGENNQNNNDQNGKNGQDNNGQFGENGRNGKKEFRYNDDIMWDFKNRDDFNAMNKTPVMCVLKTGDGELFVERNDIFFIENEDGETLVAEAEKTGKDSGVLHDYKIRFSKRELENGNEAYAFVDISSEMSLLRTQLFRSLWISLAVICVMFVISILLARWATKPVERSLEDKKRFVADASHELKTPLAVIISNTDMVVRSDDLNPKNKRRMDNIKAESARMKELVQELIDLARGDASGNQVVKEEVSFSQIVEEDILAWEALAFDAGKMIVSEIEPDISIMGNADKLKQLTDILIDNAVKYSDKNSNITVSLKTRDKNKSRKHVTLAVKNQGKMLSEEERKKIFDRFYRSDESRESTPGYGLGLAIAVQLADIHGGRLSVETAEEDGKEYNIFKFRVQI